MVHKGEQTTTNTHDNIHESHKTNIEQKKSDTQKYMQNDFICLKYERDQTAKRVVNILGHSH